MPAETFHVEWERRRLRPRVHLTIGGCLGPCDFANVVMLVFGGRTMYFQRIDEPWLVFTLYGYIEAMVEAGAWRPPPEPLAERWFTYTTWEERPDGEAVDDRHLRGPLPPPREGPEAGEPCPLCGERPDGGHACAPDDLFVPPPPGETVPLGSYAARRRPVAVDRGGTGSGAAAALPASAPVVQRPPGERDDGLSVPRRDGEMVFTEPWQGRVFGMAVALSEGGAYDWDAFRDTLITEIGVADAAGAESDYYERWLHAFERLLVERGIVSPAEVAERADEFRWGERDPAS